MIEDRRLSRSNEEGRVDDWLAEQGDLNWLDDPREGEAGAARQSQGALGQRSAAERPARVRATRSPGVPSPTGLGTIERRRLILALGTLALVVVAAVAVAIATSGGGGSGGSPAAVGTTPQTSTLPARTPGATTTPATGQSTTPAQTQPSLKVTLPAGGKLRIGDTGAAVVALQKVLATLKLNIGTPDGNFGPKTQAAVIAFQTTHALNPDGIVGVNTEQKLNEALAGAAAPG